MKNFLVIFNCKIRKTRYLFPNHEMKREKEGPLKLDQSIFLVLYFIFSTSLKYFHIFPKFGLGNIPVFFLFAPQFKKILSCLFSISFLPIRVSPPSQLRSILPSRTFRCKISRTFWKKKWFSICLHWTSNSFFFKIVF